jgi:hypothetical protein
MEVYPMIKRNLALLFVPALVFGLAACDVEDNAPETGTPDVSIRSEERQQPAGADSAGVSVQSEEREVAAPDVDVEREQETATAPDGSVQEREQSQTDTAQSGQDTQSAQQPSRG